MQVEKLVIFRLRNCCTNNTSVILFQKLTLVRTIAVTTMPHVRLLLLKLYVPAKMVTRAMDISVQRVSME